MEEPVTQSMPSRRASLLDGAITVIARLGLRGLTHRAVDQQVGVAQGSTSYYFRTRQALLAAVTERLLEADLADTGDAPRGTVLDLDVVAELTAQVVAHWVGPGRERMLARYELSLESVRDPALRPVMVAAGVGLRQRTIDLFTDLGVADAERKGRAFVAFVDGLIFDQIAGTGGERSTEDLRCSVRELLAGLTGDRR